MVPIACPKNYQRSLARDSSLWRIAVKGLLDDARLRTVETFRTLLIPQGVDGFYLTRRGIPFRCLCQYVITPMDFLPPGFRARVDVAFETTDAESR